MKLNKKAMLSLLFLIFGSLVIIYDFIKLMNGYSYTIIGFISILIIFILMSECYEYLEERSDRK